MFEGFMKSKFFTKSKSAMKMTKSRLEIIKRKRNAMQKFFKKDIADLLKNGLDVNAYGRVEGLWNELNMSNCYDFVEQFCNHILSHLTEMDKQRECPDDCREAACSLMYAAARFADLPELRDLRNLFLERYGSSIECYVHKEFVYKLKMSPPSKDMKLQLMVDIAAETGVEWTAKSLEQKLFSHPIYGQEYNKNVDSGEKNTPKNDYVQNISNKIAEHKHEDDPDKNGSFPKRRLSTKREPFDDVDNIHDSRCKEVIKPDTKIQHHELRNDETKSKPRSVRRNKKPLPGYSSEPENNEIQGGGLKKSEEEEEETMDRLLLHYSRKKNFDSDEKNGFCQKRSSSLHVEPSRIDDDEYGSKGHYARTSSLKPEMLNSNGGGHVHPKLPDYDDFVARLAAGRCNQE